MPTTCSDRLILAGARTRISRSTAIGFRDPQRPRAPQFVERDRLSRLRNLYGEHLWTERDVHVHLRQGDLQIERRPDSAALVDARETNAARQPVLRFRVIGAPSAIAS